MHRASIVALVALAAGAASCAGPSKYPFKRADESVEDALARAGQLMRTGEHTDASLLLAELTGPDATPDTLHRVAHLHQTAGRHTIARRLCERARADGGDWWHLHMDLAYEARRRHRHEEAVALYRTALQKAREQGAPDEEIWPARLGLLESLFVVGRRDEALSEARALARSERGPNDLVGHVAITLIKLGEVTEAGKLLDVLDERKRDMPVVVAARAQRLEAEGEAKAACAIFAAMLEDLDGDEIREMPLVWHQARTDVHLKADDLPGARDALDDWDSRDSDERATRGTRSVLHRLLDGRPADAIARGRGRGRADFTDPITHVILALAFAVRMENRDQYATQVSMHAAAEHDLGQFAAERRMAEWLVAKMKQIYPDQAWAIAAVDPWLALYRE